MSLIFISLITGFIGFSIGSGMNAESIFGFIGFLSPTLFVVQRIYKKLNTSEDEGDMKEHED